MFKLFKMKVPSGGTKELEAVEMWVVSWFKRTGEYYHSVEKCYQGFTNQEEAKALKKALEDAHKLIGNTSGTIVAIEKQRAGL